MVDPQENITIGNFLYALGLGIGARKGLEAPAAAVNLLQQTSYDRALGDVMLYFPGATRLFEFKRKSNTDRQKELAKHRVLTRALTGIGVMIRVSRQIHFYVETAAESDSEFAFAVRPYLALNASSIGQTRFDSFVNSIVDEATAPPDPQASRLANIYIRDFVGSWGTGKGHSSTGLLVSVGAGGKVRYAVVDDLADLAATGKSALQLQMQRFLVREQIFARVQQLQTQARAQELVQGPGKKPDKGLEYERTIG